VVINIAGGGGGGCGGGSNVVSIGSNVSLSNNSYIPSYFTIDYGGTGGIYVKGNTDIYAVIDAPQAAVTMAGGSAFYGQVLGDTISDTGGAAFYWDRGLINSTPPLPYLTEISMRELSY
jgi:hypothetical protein